MSNKVQNLFDELIEKYNLRAIKIDDETWYAMNDLPLNRKAINMKMSNLRKSKSTEGFVNDNTIIIKNSTIKENGGKFKVNNTGETFGTKDMILKIVNESKMSIEDKKEYLDFFEVDYVVGETKEDGFIDGLERALAPFGIKGIKQYSILGYKIDYYIESLNIAIEYDENGHEYYSHERHELRQELIEDELECKFIRVTDKESHEYNIGYVIKNIFNL